MSDKNRNLGAVGAIAGILAAIIAVIASVIGAFLFLDKRYVHSSSQQISDLKERYETTLSSEINSQRMKFDELSDNLSLEASTKIEEIEKNLAESKVNLISIQSFEGNAEKIVEEIAAQKLPYVNIVAYNTGSGPNDGLDKGKIESRTLEFKKSIESSNIRIIYSDNFRVIGSAKACRWKITIDDKECATNQSNQLNHDRYSATASNVHAGGIIFGYCSGIPKGQHKIEVSVSPVRAQDKGADCYTGWNNTTWTIEAAEIVSNN